MDNRLLQIMIHSHKEQDALQRLSFWHEKHDILETNVVHPASSASES